MNSLTWQAQIVFYTHGHTHTVIVRVPTQLGGFGKLVLRYSVKIGSILEL